VSYQSIDQMWTQWSWTVSVQRRDAQQFSYLENASVAGFALRGGGSAIVTTPAFYPPGAVATVTMSRGGTGTAIADADGRLHLTVSLGIDRPTVAIVGEPQELGTLNTVTISIN
jgi:hypothetical protein